MRIVGIKSARRTSGIAAATVALLGAGLVLSGCGHSDPGPPTLSVTCDGSLMLAGASSVSVTSSSGGALARLSFPDPANPGQTGTLPVEAGRACVITPVAGEGKSAGDNNHPPPPAH